MQLKKHFLLVFIHKEMMSATEGWYVVDVDIAACHRVPYLGGGGHEMVSRARFGKTSTYA